jgi:drug/metabolite transporter (DMT)-like permease
LSSEPIPSAAATGERRQTSIGYLLAATGAILFSIKAVIVKLAYALDVDAETLLALRMGFSLPFYLGIGFLAVQGRRHKLAALPSMGRTIRAALIGMLGMWVASYTDFLGLQ